MKSEKDNSNIEIERCPLCHRHCPLSDPHCGKGSKYARNNSKQEINKNGVTEKETTAIERDEQWVTMLQKCAYLLSGKKGKSLAKDILTEEEVKQLEDLLSKLTVALEAKHSQKDKKQDSTAEAKGRKQKHEKEKKSHKHHGKHEGKKRSEL